MITIEIVGSRSSEIVDWRENIISIILYCSRQPFFVV